MIYAICGFQSSGKDTVADYLVTHCGFKKLSFASVLKDVVAIMFDWSRDKLEGLTKEDREWREVVDEYWSKELNMPQLTPRYVLQYFGTELFRNHFHQDIWLKIVQKQLDKYSDIVITDCRFPNEYAMLQEKGAAIIKIIRNTPEWYEEYLNDKTCKSAELVHPSEKEWIHFQHDYLINNTDTISALYNEIQKMNTHFKATKHNGLTSFPPDKNSNFNYNVYDYLHDKNKHIIKPTSKEYSEEYIQAYLKQAGNIGYRSMGFRE